MNILFLVAEFAPVNTTGNFRSLKLVKYLPETGVNPIVVTMTVDEAVKIFKAKVDYDLLKEIPDSVAVYRVKPDTSYIRKRGKLRSFAHIFFRVVDDIGSNWKKNLFSSVSEVIERHKIEAIYTSLPPFSMGLVARALAKRHNLPLLVDMRDLWSHWGSDPHPTYFHFLVSKYLERKVFKYASLVFCATPQLATIFKKTHPLIDSEKFVTLTNGFDSLSESSGTVKEKVSNDYGKKFVIGYTGAFYYSPCVASPRGFGRIKYLHRIFHYSPSREDWLYRSPYFFLRALAFLLKREPDIADRIQFAYIGNEPEWLRKMVEDFSLQKIYVSYGFRTAKETSEIQNSFDAFLATSEKVINGEHYCMPSKVFDYVNKGKPIVGFVTEGIQKEFLTRSGMALICNPDNIEESADTLRSLINMKMKAFSVNNEYLQGFTRRSLARKFSDSVKLISRR